MLLDGKGAHARDAVLDAAHELSWTSTVPAGQCTRVTVGVQGDGAGVDLRASDPSDGTDLDRAEAAHATSVRACAGPGSSRPVRFDVRVSAGKLDAVIGEQTAAP
jgi:hypothetical protein